MPKGRFNDTETPTSYQGRKQNQKGSQNTAKSEKTTLITTIPILLYATTKQTNEQSEHINKRQTRPEATD